jgi:hypothetical protein
MRKLGSYGVSTESQNYGLGLRLSHNRQYTLLLLHKDSHSRSVVVLAAFVWTRQAQQAPHLSTKVYLVLRRQLISCEINTTFISTNWASCAPSVQTNRFQKLINGRMMQSEIL